MWAAWRTCAATSWSPSRRPSGRALHRGDQEALRDRGGCARPRPRRAAGAAPGARGTAAAGADATGAGLGADVLPKSPLGEALTYLRNQMRYVAQYIRTAASRSITTELMPRADKLRMPRPRLCRVAESTRPPLRISHMRLWATRHITGLRGSEQGIEGDSALARGPRVWRVRGRAPSASCPRASRPPWSLSTRARARARLRSGRLRAGATPWPRRAAGVGRHDLADE